MRAQTRFFTVAWQRVPDWNKDQPGTANVEYRSER